MLTRRGFINGTLGAGAGLGLTGRDLPWAAAQTGASEIERNKAVIRRFKDAMGTKEEDAVMREIAPNIKRVRVGMENLNVNARDQGFPSAGPGLRNAFPDRNDMIEDMVADGDMVAMKYRSRGTHAGNFNGIPPTGKKYDIQNFALFRLADGKITEAWFMTDEAGLLLTLGAKLPARKDGKLMPPPIAGAGEDPDVFIKRLEAGQLVTVEDRDRLLIARTKGSARLSRENYTADFRQLRNGFAHLRDFGQKNGNATQTLDSAVSERRDRIENIIAEGDRVVMRFHVVAVHTKPLYGLLPTGKRIEVAEIGLFRITDGKIKDAWYYGDELGLLLQLGVVNTVIN
jgi:predicted ester cyclase